MKIIILTFLITLFPLFVQRQGKTTTIEIPIEAYVQSNNINQFFPSYQYNRSKIALALSGGGARGLAHIGVLKVFEKQAITIDGIAGTSIGAIIGGFSAIGYSATEIENLASKINWNEIIHDTPPRQQLFLAQKEQRARHMFQIRFKGFSLDIRSAYTAGQKFSTILAEHILNAPYSFNSDFDKLNIRFRAVTTDLISGEKVVLKNGSMVKALRASMAIPLLFTPVTINNRLLVDGGLVQNLPTTEAKSLKADIIIAVDTSSKLRNTNTLKAPWEIADQVTTIMHREKIQEQIKIADLLIQPKLENISNTDFDKIEQIIRAGEKAAEHILPQIEKLISNNTKSKNITQFHVKKIKLSGLINLSTDFFINSIAIDTTKPVSIDQINWAGQSLLQSGYFNTISAELDTVNNILTFKVTENTFVENIEIWGNTVFNDSILISDLQLKTGAILNFQKGRQDLRSIIKKYHETGYALARIADINIHNNSLQIGIDEGKISNINLIGNNRTLPFVILRNLSIKPGNLFNVSLLKKGIENIYSTGYFEGVQFDVTNKPNSHELTLYLIERGFNLLRLGLRYNIERQTQGFLEAVEENLFGLGIESSLMGLLGNRDKMIQACLRSDRLFNTFLTTKLNVSSYKRYFNYYKNNKSIGEYSKSGFQRSLALGQQMRRLGTLFIQLCIERIHIKPVSGKTPEEKFTLRNLTIKSEIDTRDRVPFPKTGKYHLLEYETAGQFLGSEVSYIKLRSSMESYYPLSSSIVFHPKIQWGTADLTTPFVKQFSLGGLESFLGLPENGLIGRRFFSFNFECRYKIPWPKYLESYFSIRYDFGGIWSGYEKITTRDFKHGIGFIFTLNTPVGPIQLANGHMSDGIKQFYLSAGYKF
jgi:NTE family protein